MRHPTLTVIGSILILAGCGGRSGLETPAPNVGGGPVLRGRRGQRRFSFDRWFDYQKPWLAGNQWWHDRHRRYHEHWSYRGNRRGPSRRWKCDSRCYRQRWIVRSWRRGEFRQRWLHCRLSYRASFYTATRWLKNGQLQSGAGTFGATFMRFFIMGDPRRAWGYFKDIYGRIADEFTITLSSPAQ